MTSLNNDNRTGIVNIRRAILDLLQSEFYNDPVYTWRPNPGSRKIDIVNEFATNRSEIEFYPKVVLSRGDIGLRNINLDRRGDLGSLFQPDTHHVQDLSTGTLILNVLSKSMIEAEQIAEKIFFKILSKRDQIRWSYVILKVTDLSIGSAQVVQQDSDFRVFQIPIYIRYDKEINFRATYDYYDVDLTVGGEHQYQTSDFWIFDKYVYFVDPPGSGLDIEMSYYHRETLSGVTELSHYPANGERTVFPFTHPIYGPYYLISGLTVDLDNFYDYYTFYSDIIGDGVNSIQITQEAGPTVHRQGHSYVLPGNISVAVGSTNYIPPFYISNAAGQVTKLSSCTFKLQTAGDIAYCNILRNGNVIPTYSGIAVTDTKGNRDADDIYLQNGDSLALEIGSIQGSPENLSFTIFLDYIQ